MTNIRYTIGCIVMICLALVIGSALIIQIKKGVDLWM